MAFPPKPDKKQSPPPAMKNSSMSPTGKTNGVFTPGKKGGKLPFNDSSKKSASPFASNAKTTPKKKGKKMCGPCTAKNASSCSHL